VPTRNKFKGLDDQQSSTDGSVHSEYSDNWPNHDENNGWEFTRDERHRQKQQQQRRSGHKIISGKGSTNSGNFRGAPEPSRELFIYRVDSDVTCNDLTEYIVEKGIKYRNVECMSNPHDKYKSFKLQVPVSEFNQLFDESLWPAGTKVRKFIPPKNID
jgi:hypothetical protein